MPSMASYLPADDVAAPRRPQRVAIVTPVLDDWTCFGALIHDISALYTGSGIEFVVWMIDDGSISQFDQASVSLPPESCVIAIEMVRLAINLGHQRAIAVGLCALADRADLDWVVVMDSDGEDRASDIAALLAAGRQNDGHVVLARRAKRSEPAFFRLAYKIYKLLFRVLTGQPITFGNYSMLPMTAVRRLVYMPELWNNLAASILRSRLPCTEVATLRGGRYDGNSRMNFVGLVVHALSAFSVHADRIFVRVMLGTGLVALVSVIGLIAVVAIRMATDLAIPGWATSATGFLLVILLQTFVVFIAVTLTMLTGRTNRPIIPIEDVQKFVAERHQHVFPSAGQPAPPHIVR